MKTSIPVVSVSAAIAAMNSHLASYKEASAVLAIRHTIRDKKNPDKAKRQDLTPAGYLLSNVLGAHVGKANMILTDIISSDQERAVATARAFTDGYNAIHGEHWAPDYDQILVDERLGDFSGSVDKFPIIKAGLETAKAYAAKHGIDTEEAVFKTPEGRKAMQWRAEGYRSCFLDLLARPGLHAAFCHGPNIDAATDAINSDRNWKLGKYPEHPIGYCEGIVILGNIGCGVEDIIQYTYPTPIDLHDFMQVWTRRYSVDPD